MPKQSATPNESHAKLATDHLNLAVAIANEIHATLPAHHLDRQELVAPGMLGLVEAARKYDPKKKDSFRSYAKHRIRGAIQDSLRWLDRSPTACVSNTAMRSALSPI